MNQTPQITPKDTQEKFEAKMEEIKLKEKERETEAQARAQNLNYINLKGFPISPEALSLIPKEQAQKTQTICFLSSGHEFRFGSLNPADPTVKEVLWQVAERTHGKGDVYLISRESFNFAFALYDKLPTPRVIVKGVEIKEEDINKFGQEFHSFDELAARLKDAPVTDVVNMLVAAALQAKASDVHFEAEENSAVARFRIDGILHNVASLPKEYFAKLASRVKLISGLKINITDRPQDGRFTIFLSEDKVDVRVSSIPTSFGESLVMRLLRSTGTGLKLEDLGVRGTAFENFKKEISRPNGMIITTGPTGSGKTTTMYAILSSLNDQETKIITLEDPIEYQLKGIAQSQIDYSKDYTFAKGLRSILRQDPDVVMVGEVRDLETAEIAIQAALTGHLVLSTIHTNSASGAIPRFLSMGVKPFLLTPALNAIIGQRLVRRVCESCKEEARLDEETLARVKKALSEIPEIAGIKVNLDNLRFFHGKGCEKCFNLGYKGRIGIYEIFSMNKEIEKVILSGEISEYAMQEIAVKNGMVTMVQDGLLKALEGITSVEEVFGVAE
ncbi:MAG: GspE/PulE family protein [bacterium]|nr:GspE/PulE family protein [bacterium]